MADYTQDPGDRLDYTLDWSSFLTGGETILTATWTAQVGLTADGALKTASTTTIFLSGGSAGLNYGVTCHVVTSGGREGDKSFTLGITQQTVLPTTGGISARTLITRALMLTGTVADGQTPSASLAEQGRLVLAEIVDAWSADELFLYQGTRSQQAFVANQADYTVGIGGDFNIPRPAFITAVTLLDTTASPVFEFEPLEALDDAAWANVPDKARTDSMPTGYTLDRGAPWMTLTFYPVPSASTYAPVLYTPGGILNDVPTLDTVLVLPPGYGKALRYTLASELSLIPGISPAPRGDLGKMAAMAISRIKSGNVQIGILGVDDALTGGGAGYNWRTGQ